VIKDFFTRNIGLKLLASVIALVLWGIARFWVQ